MTRTRVLNLIAVAVLAVCALPVVASQSAKVEVDKFPSSMDPNEKGEVQVTVTNTGTELWPPETEVVVGAVEDPEGNDVDQTPFDVRRKVGQVYPGYGETMGGNSVLKIEAPMGRGKWKLEAWVEIRGTKLKEAKPFEIEVTSGYDGKFSSYSRPGDMKAGATYKLELTVQNTGSVWWDPEEVALNCTVKRALLGKVADATKAFQKKWTAVKNGDVVYPGESAKFVITFSAPATLGKWELEWQMYDLEENELFGQKGLTTVQVTKLK